MIRKISHAAELLYSVRIRHRPSPSCATFIVFAGGPIEAIELAKAAYMEHWHEEADLMCDELKVLYDDIIIASI